MLISQKICIIVYTLIMLQCMGVSVHIFAKAKKTDSLYALLAINVIIIAWLLFGMFENMSSTNKELLFSIRLTLIPITLLGSAWLIFSLIYVGWITYRNKKTIFAIILLPVLSYLPALTDKYFYLLVISKEVSHPEFTHWGVFFVANYALTIIYLTSGGAIFLYKAFHEYKHQKGKILMLLTGVLVVTAFFLISSFQLIPLPRFDIAPISFSIFLMLLTVSIYRYRLLDITQEAANQVFNTMGDAIAVFDLHNNLVNYNQAFVHELVEDHDISEIRTLTDLELLLTLRSRGASAISFDNVAENSIVKSATGNFGSWDSQVGLNKKYYTYSLSPFRNDRGKMLGRILSIKDHTGTINTERNRLSADIHDTIGNSLTALLYSLNNARDEIKNTKKAEEYINMASVETRTVMVHFRRILSELKPIDIEEKGLVSTLHSQLNKFRRYGIEIRLSHTGIETTLLNKGQQAADIYNMCLHTISNAVSHGKATEINLVLSLRNNIFKMLVIDNGIGCTNIVFSGGLKQMDERIKAMGGTFAATAPDDGGFQINVSFPVMRTLCESEVSHD